MGSSRCFGGVSRAAAVKPRTACAYADTDGGEGAALDVWLTHLLEALAGLGAWRFLVAFVGIFCETSLFVGLLIPGDTIVLLTASVNRDAVDWVLLVASVVAGALAGESVGYLIGRLFGPRLRVSRLGRRIGERQWLRSEQWLDRRGGVAIFVSRFLPVLHALTPVTVGATGYPYRRFLAWTAPACLLWAVVYVSVGMAAGTSYLALAGQLHSAGWFVLGGLVVVLILIAIAKRFLHRLERE